MPLKQGKSKAVIRENVKREIATGRVTPKQAVAIAYNTARRSKPAYSPRETRGGRR